MNQLPAPVQAQIFHCLAEGCSVRSTARLLDVSINAVMRTFVKLGKACEAYQSQTFRNLPCTRIELDELHSYVGAREGNASVENRLRKQWGTVWVWLAICPDTKLIPAWFVGERGEMAAQCLLQDLARKLAGRVQLSADAHGAYPPAIENVFGVEADFAQLVKVFSTDHKDSRVKYAPPHFTGAKKIRVSGNPDMTKVCTSYVERANLTVRMTNRRFTRLTNAFSKKQENHRLSLAITFMHYNFCKIHGSLRVTPAMEAKVTNHIWEPAEVIGLLARGGSVKKVA